MKGLVTALKQTSRRRIVATTGAAGLLAGASFACELRGHKAYVLPTKLYRVTIAARKLLGRYRLKYSEGVVEQEKLLDELKSRKDSISKSATARLHHVVELWPLQIQDYKAWYLQA